MDKYLKAALLNQAAHAALMQEAKDTAKAYYELLGGDDAKCGNVWDPWNQVGISWRVWNDSQHGDRTAQKVVFSRMKTLLNHQQLLNQETAAKQTINTMLFARPTVVGGYVKTTGED